jgi:hypothetical protein
MENYFLFVYYIMTDIVEPTVKLQKQRITPFNRMGLGYVHALLGRAEKRGDIAEAEQCRAEIDRRKNTKITRATTFLEVMKNKIQKTGVILPVLEEISFQEPVSSTPVPEPEPSAKPKRVRKTRKPNVDDIPVPAISDTEFVDNITKMKLYIKHYLKANPALNNMKFSFQL